MADQPTYRIASSMVVRDRDGRILVVREADLRVYGKVNLPGGHLEPGETPVQCATRELAEETGLQLTPSALLRTYMHSHGVNFVFLGQSVSTTVRPGHDILTCEWLTPDEILALPDAAMLRARKLRVIIADTLSGVQYPVDSIHLLDEEDWEQQGATQAAPGVVADAPNREG